MNSIAIIVAMKKTVSVVIPVYNEEKYIKFCLDTLFAQTRKPLEIIVVDDSTDNTWNILRSYKPSDKRVAFRIFRTVHKGPAPARNLGAKKSIGDILVFVDGDMKFHRDYLKFLVAPIEKDRAIATFTKDEYVANPENVWSRCWSINSYMPTSLRIRPEVLDTDTNFRAIRRDVFFKTTGYKDVGYGEDTTVLVQLKGAIAIAAKNAICYHYNPSSLSEVFVSARWNAKGPHVSHTLRSILTYSLPNSIRRGVIESVKYKSPAFLVFKIVFDFAFFVGIIERILGRSYVK